MRGLLDQWGQNWMKLYTTRNYVAKVKESVVEDQENRAVKPRDLPLAKLPPLPADVLRLMETPDEYLEKNDVEHLLTVFCIAQAVQSSAMPQIPWDFLM